MATIRKLRGRWQAQVRRKGMAPRAKSFDKKADAEQWARSLEAEVDRCGSLPDTRIAENTTLGEIMTRYRDEISPTKRSIIRINALLRRPICHRTLTLLSSSDIATYRDERLKTVAPATVVRELNTISHALEIAQREWGVYLARNPVKLVRRPTPPRGRTRRLEGDEEQRLLTAADQGRNPFMKPIIILNRVYFEIRSFSVLGSRWSLSASRSARAMGSWLILSWKSATLTSRPSRLAWQCR